MNDFTADEVRVRLRHSGVEVDPEKAAEIAGTANAFGPLLDQIWIVAESELTQTALPAPAPWQGMDF